MGDARATSEHGLVHVVANAAARRAGKLPKLLQALDEAGVSATVHRPPNSDDLRAIAASCAALGRDATVIAAGGDGTLHGVVDGLLSTGVLDGDSLPAVAIWPLGTANVTAREVGAYGRRPAVLADWIVHGDRTLVQIGQLSGATTAWFVQMASAGFDAMIVAAVPGGLKKTIGAGAYVVRALGALRRYRPTPLTVTIDGRDYSAGQVIVANGRLYGGSYMAAPAADLTAARFDACLMNPGGRRQIAAAGFRLMLGRFAHGVKVVPGTNVRIRSAGTIQVPLQADGDTAGTTPVELRAGAATLRLVMAPSQALGGVRESVA